MTKHTPATPLPVTPDEIAARIYTLESAHRSAMNIVRRDRAKLVEALREVIAGRYEADASRARALLRELGEE